MKSPKETLKKGFLKKPAKLFFIALVPFFALSFYFLNPEKNAVEITPASEVKAAPALKDSFQFNQLPSSLAIGSVYESKVENPKGTAILFPQTHRNPGTDVSDPVNNDAQIAQEQIYNVMSYLNKNQGINFIMAEGDLYGPVPEDKISKLSQEIRLRDNLAKLSLGKGLLGNLTQMLDREIDLAGAPYKLRAENSDLILYGAENQATYNQSADIVRNYVYLNDRKSQIEKGEIVPAASLQHLSNQPSSSIPSRADNPYFNVNSLDEINSLIKNNEQEMENVVLNQRNHETAQNFAKALNDKNESVGMIEFGAEHEKGLVKELNNQGLSVIVITTQEVQNRS